MIQGKFQMTSARILIVDDNINQRKSMAFILEKKGYSVATAKNGFEAIEIVNKEPFEIVFMDIRMPVMDGVETFRAVKEIRPETIVIMMTAYALDELIAEALEEGAFAIIYKPIDIERVLALIENARLGNKGALILVVDDEPDMRNSFKIVLESKGHRVKVAKSGEEAIELAENIGQSILFIDMKLPKINGLETYLRIKEKSPEAIAVMITGYKAEMKQEIRDAICSDAYTCLYKPLDMKQILRTIDEIQESC
jgi:two-component system, NtrC family, response regulator HydG